MVKNNKMPAEAQFTNNQTGKSQENINEDVTVRCLVNDEDQFISYLANKLTIGLCMKHGVVVKLS